MDTDNTNTGTQTNSTTTIVGNNDTVNNDITSILQDNTGGLSSIRILMLLWGCGVFLIWGFGAVMAILHGLPFPSLPPEIITVLLGITGIKTVQRFGEK
jgi:hypothetical protein